MTKLTGKNYTWEPHMSDWQRDRASAPFDRAPHGSGFFWTVVAYASVAVVVFAISCLSAWWSS